MPKAGSGRDPQALGGVTEVTQESAQASTRSTSSNNSSLERPVTNSSSLAVLDGKRVELPNFFQRERCGSDDVKQ